MAPSKRDRLRLGIDLGTGYIRINGQHLRGDDTAEDAENRALSIKGRYGDPSIKQIAVYHEDGTVVYGAADVDKLITDNPDDRELQDKAMELWKLALHPEFQHLDEVKHVNDILQTKEDRGSLQEFLRDQLHCIFRDVRVFYHKHPNFNSGEDENYWNTIPLELQISVPAMWGDEQQGVLRNAAKTAEATRSVQTPRVELRLEPLCVATIYMLDLIKYRNIKEGQCLLVIDCGKGTLDIATIKLVCIPEAGQLMQLQRIGLCSGNGAGAHIINALSWAWLCGGNCAEVEELGLNETCRQLGVTAREFQRQWSNGIDQAKKELDGGGLNSIAVNLRSSHGKIGEPGHLYQLSVALAPHQIKSWVTTWVNAAKQLVVEHLTEQVENEAYACASLTGGGADSTEFSTQMEALLGQPQYNIPVGAPMPHISPCSAGALRQHCFQEDTLPPNAHFYVARTEIYEAKKHPDAAAVAGRIEQSEYDPNVRIVRDRLTRIVKYSKKLGFESHGLLPMMFYVDAYERLSRLHVDLFFSEKTMRKNSPLFDADGTRREGLRAYPLMFIDPDDFGKDGFTKIEPEDGTPHYEVKGFVEMEGTNDHLLLTVYLMKHDYQFPDACLESPDGQPTSSARKNATKWFNKNQILKQHTDEVWHKHSSHFVSASTGTVGSRSKAGAKSKKHPAARQGARKSGRINVKAESSDDEIDA